MKKNVALLLLLFCLLPIHLYAEDKSVSLATLTDFAPFCFRKENSIQLHKETIPPGKDSAQLQGYSWDVVRQSFHEMGYTIELYVVPWERVLHYLKSGKVDAIFPANRTEAREKNFRYSKEYVDRTKMVAYVPATSNILWESLDSLNGLRVGVVRGWAYGKVWEGNQQIIKETMDTILQGFQLMEKKRLDAVIGYEVTYDYVLKTSEIANRFKKIGYFGIVDEYMMIQKENPATLQKIDDFDQGHKIIEEKGDLEKISRAWLN